MDTKILRQKILDLAIRGKLVPQDPNDEPASVLLERIRAEKERLIKEGKIKRSKKSAKSSDTPHYPEEVPFEVPESWEWTTIGEIASSILYGVSESAKETGQYKLLRITDIQNNKVNWETVPFTNYDNNKAQAYLLNDGDILFARTGATVGKSYLVEGLKDSAIYASYLIRVQTSSVILPAYITSMLVVKDVVIDFKDYNIAKDFKHKFDQVKHDGGAGVSIGILGIGARANVSYLDNKKHDESEYDIDQYKSKITIPGMQIVGYRCHLLSQSPNPLPGDNEWA